MIHSVIFWFCTSVVAGDTQTPGVPLLRQQKAARVVGMQGWAKKYYLTAGRVEIFLSPPEGLRPCRPAHLAASLAYSKGTKEFSKDD